MNKGRVGFVSFLFGTAVILAVCAHVGHAQILTADVFSGRATGVVSTTTTNGTPTTVVTGDTCPLPARGGTSTVTTSGIITPGRLATGTIVSTTSGSGITSQSSSSVSDFFFSGGGWTVRASNVSTKTQCNCCDIASPGCSGQTAVSGLVVTDPSGATVPITVTGSANQVVTLPNGAGTITFNETTAGPGTLTVNGMHINITVSGTNYNVVVASSHSDITCPGIIVTAGDVNISGRTVDANGDAIPRATVVITNSQGEAVRSAISDDSGQYVLVGVRSGQTYIVQASHRAYIFTPRSINLLDEVTGFNLIGSPR